LPFFFFLHGKISLLGDKENCSANPEKSYKGFFWEKNPIKLPYFEKKIAENNKV
jgi:hypothetical protein